MSAIGPSGSAVALFNTVVDPDGLFRFAQKRVQATRDRGIDFAESAIVFFGTEFLKAVALEDDDAMGNSAFQATVSAWLYENVYKDITEDDYRSCALRFNIHTNGRVEFRRLPEQG